MTQTSPHTHTHTHTHTGDTQTYSGYTRTQGMHTHRGTSGSAPRMDGLAKVQPNPNPQFTYTRHQDLNVSYNPTPTNVFFPENLTGPLSRALLTQEGQEWRVPVECRQDIMAEGRAGVLLSALGELHLSPVQGPWGATQGSPLLVMILHFSSGCDPRFALELHSLETSWGSFMDSFIQKMPDPRLGEDRDSWTQFRPWGACRHFGRLDLLAAGYMVMN